MGRVNGHQRLRYAKAIGCDSVDGTSFSWFKDRWLADFLDHAAGPTQLAVASHSNSREISLYAPTQNPCKTGYQGADQNRTGVRGLSPISGCSRPDA
jgi:hypothetical protein